MIVCCVQQGTHRAMATRAIFPIVCRMHIHQPRCRHTQKSTHSHSHAHKESCKEMQSDTWLAGRDDFNKPASKVCHYSPRPEPAPSCCSGAVP